MARKRQTKTDLWGVAVDAEEIEASVVFTDFTDPNVATDLIESIEEEQEWHAKEEREYWEAFETDFPEILDF